MRANNYQSACRSFCRRKRLPNQAQSRMCFHELFLSNSHNGIDNWNITIIDHTETVKALGRKELHWYQT